MSVSTSELEVKKQLLGSTQASDFGLIWTWSSGSDPSLASAVEFSTDSC